MQRMRRNDVYLTGIEKTVKRWLEGRGIKFIPQYPLRGGYIADFVLPNRKIIVEVDGEKWHSSKERTKKDKFRDYMLKRAGWTTIRIKERDINNLEKLLSSIR